MMLLLVLAALLLAMVATWWVIGLRTDVQAIGFSEIRVSFDFQDMNLEEAIGYLRPGVQLRIEEPTEFVVTLKVKEMPEQHAFRWIAQLSDQQIELPYIRR